mmetsp:Transcript_3576/g.6295  ORF Transcript_3576/g.6295 Transcript_3576/m.6295 type:complete len:97 (+) Transcript_3576:108-398(+)
MLKLRILPLLLLAALGRTSISTAFLALAEAPKTMLPRVVGSLIAATPEIAFAKDESGAGQAGIINLVVLGVGIVAFLAVIVVPAVIFSGKPEEQQK